MQSLLERGSTLSAIMQGPLHGLGDQILSGPEMPVEATMSHSCFIHQSGEADTIDTGLPKARRSPLNDALVARFLFFPRMTHASQPFSGL